MLQSQQVYTYVVIAITLKAYSTAAFTAKDQTVSHYSQANTSQWQDFHAMPLNLIKSQV